MNHEYSNYQYESKIRSMLDGTEQILWSGKGNPPLLNIVASKEFAFSLFWTAFAVFWTLSASGLTMGLKKGFQLFGLFGIPFILVGIGMLWTPFRKIKQLKKTFYVLTDRRVIIAVMADPVRMDSHYLNQLAQMDASVKADGSGDIVFGTKKSKMGQDEPFGFFGIPDVGNVEKMINSARGKTTDSSLPYGQ